jgi:mRNA interferase RelE/StbE
MHVEFLAKFHRDLDRIHHKSIKESLADLIEAVKIAESISEIKNLKKLKGFKTAYRIRMGDYRIGVFIEASTVEFARILNRREIYRFFP